MVELIEDEWGKKSKRFDVIFLFGGSNHMKSPKEVFIHESNFELFGSEFVGKNIYKELSNAFQNYSKSDVFHLNIPYKYSRLRKCWHIFAEMCHTFAEMLAHFCGIGHTIAEMLAHFFDLS